MATSNEVYIGDEDLIVLSAEKVELSYGTRAEFGRRYGINASTLNRAFKQPGVQWKTLNKRNTLNKIYIDWDKTKFYIVDPKVKEAYITVAEYEKGATDGISV